MENNVDTDKKVQYELPSRSTLFAQALRLFNFFHAQLSCHSMKFSLLIDMKMPTIVGFFIFISREIYFHAYVCLASKNMQLIVI